jgi:Flp pilus assembly pilin Flp
MNDPAPRRHQRGQAIVEYTIIGFLLSIALFTPVPGITPSQTAGQLLAGAIRAFYDNVTYFLSLP